MRVLIDENMSSRRLAARLQSVGHDVLLASDVGQGSVSDARVLAWAVAQDRPVLTRDHEDFADLHDLVLAVGGHHPGIPVVRGSSCVSGGYKLEFAAIAFTASTYKRLRERRKSRHKCLSQKS